MAANTFRSYEVIHLGKGTEDGRKKAEDNGEQARYLEKVLKDTEFPLDSEKPRCDKPPKGWNCTRPRGHDGPCAAAPIL